MNKKIYQPPFVEIVEASVEHIMIGESNIEQDHDVDSKDFFGDDEEGSTFGPKNLWDD